MLVFLQTRPVLVHSKFDADIGQHVPSPNTFSSHSIRLLLAFPRAKRTGMRRVTQRLGISKSIQVE